jgi:Tol biopolymer transport system component
VVTAQQSGRGRIIGTVGPIADTVFVNIPPDGTISFVQDAGVYISRLGGAVRTLLAGPPIHGQMADWSPDGQLLAISTSSERIRVIALDGSVRFVGPGGGPEVFPKFSADGQWIYYSIFGIDAFGWQIRRVHPDGSGDEQVSAANGLEVAPAPSPDGTKLAYTVTGLDQLWVRNLSGGASTLLAANGHSPAWSPDGSLIAYNVTHSDQELWVVSSTGTNARKVSGRNSPYALGIDWSPDGLWLIARSERGSVDLIAALGGGSITLPFSGGWTAPAWKQ